MSNNSDTPAVAFGWPGMPPKWTSSSKEGVGTAYSTSSRVWFTLSHGILNEVYYPTIDHPQIRDLQFLVTDGKTFFHEEKRDMDYKVDYIETGLGYFITSIDRGGRYRIVKEIIADPSQSCVLINVKIETELNEEWLNNLKVYVLLAPHLDVGGWGNSARRVRVAGNTLLAAWKGDTHLALGVNNGGFVKTSCGYAGYSDGWQDLKDNLQLDWEFEKAEDGNIAVIGEIDISKNREFTLGLAFGDGFHAAVTTLIQSLSVKFSLHHERFVEQWIRICCNVYPLDKYSYDKGKLYRASHHLLMAHEDKTFAGAFIASASIPWGSYKGDEDIGGYHLVWTRDLFNSASGLLACGAKETARRALVYMACSQRADGGFPQNFWIDGKPYWSGIQLDEVAFPIILAWRLWKENALGEFNPYPMVKAGAAYLIRQGPMTQQERWEENSGYSPSTLASNIAALICAAEFAKSFNEKETAKFLEEYADFLESRVEQWTVTTQGELLPDVPRHYIRIHPTDIYDFSPNEDPNCGIIDIRNRLPGSQWQFPAKNIIDAGFLELVRYGIRKPNDSLIEDSLKVVDACLKVDTPFGPCWRRYNNDGYGQRPAGGPFLGWGKGRAWPLLTGERGHYELMSGRDVSPYIKAMESFASKGGMLPEQVWDEADHKQARMSLGRPTGSAMPLMWAHAEYIKLLRSVDIGQASDFIQPVADRYYSHKRCKKLEIWKPIRQLRQVRPGQVLRILSPAPYRLRWTDDEWQKVNDTEGSSSGLGIYFVDIYIKNSQTLPVRFTFFWKDKGEWSEQEYTVEICRQ